MATISLTTISEPYATLGYHRVTMGRYTGPASYVTNGDSFLPAEVGLGVIDFIDFENAIDATPANRLLTYNVSTNLVTWVIPSTNAEVANGVDLSTFSARFIAYGR
jgi:hypothetical protein